MQKWILCSYVLMCTIFISSNSIAQEAKWSANFGPTGVDGIVKAIIQWGDSTVIAGDINGLPGSSYSSEFVIYDNIDKSWHLVKNGPDGEIRAMAVNDDGELILGGNFTFTYAGYTHTNIVKYDKNGNWSSIPGDVENGFFGAINVLLWHDSSLYIGGEFLTAGGWPYKAFAIWNETNGFTSPYPELEGFSGPNPVVNALSFSESHGNKIYIGGEFVCPGDTSTSLNVGRYDIATKQFEAFGLDVLGPVYSLYTNNDIYYKNKLVVGGEFHEVVTIHDFVGPPVQELCSNIITFDVTTNTYDTLNGGANGPVYVISKYADADYLSDNIIIGGEFDSTAFSYSGPIAKWSQSAPGSWEEYNHLLSAGSVYDIDVSSSFLRIGGEFDYLSDSSLVNNVLVVNKFSPNEWSALGDGLVRSTLLSHISVNDVAVDTAGNAYVTGNFDYGGGVKLNHIGKWNKTAQQWESLGDGISSGGTTILEHNDTVYVGGGSFLSDASGVSVNGIAMWDGVQWNALGEGLPGANVLDMVMDTLGNLYVCGSNLDSAGAVAVGGVAMWNGTTWETVGDPITNGFIFDIYIDQETNDVYVCGDIVLFGANSIRSDGVLKWDGNTWSGFGEATYLTDFGSPKVITKSPEGDIIIGGNYDGSGIYEYSFGMWRPYKGTNVTNNATQMETIGCELFLAGDPIAGSNNISRFNGFDWDNLSNGVNSGALGFDNYEQDLYVAGDFKLANGKFAQGFSIWNGIPDPDAEANLSILSPLVGDTFYYGTVKQIAWDPNTTVENLLIELSPDSGANWSVVNSRAKASVGFILWLIPDSINSLNCILRISDASKPCITKVESGVFTILDNPEIDVTWLTRYTDGGSYQEPFMVRYHNWSFSNKRENMWPDTHVDTLSDPKFVTPFIKADATFPNWYLYVDAVGKDFAYLGGVEPLYEPKAMLLWKSIMNKWEGSCFGFSQSTLLWWIGNFYNTGVIVPDTFQYNFILDDFYRTIVNKHQLYQFGYKHAKYDAGVAYYKPMTTLRTIRSAIEDKNPRSVSFTWKAWKQKEDGMAALAGRVSADSAKKGSGHNVVPYKIVTFPDTLGIYYLYIADPNFPASRDQYIRIDSADQSWTYPNYPSVDEPRKFFPSLPIIEFVGTAMDERVTNNINEFTGNSIEKIVSNNIDDAAFLYSSGSLEILVTDSIGNQIGSVDREDVHTLPGAGPIYNLEPEPTDDVPLGFVMPLGKYDIEMTDFLDSSMVFTFMNDSSAYSYQRNTDDSTQIDRIQIDSSISIVNPDTAIKKISIISVDINSDNQLYVQLDSLVMTQNDSTVVGFDPSGAIKIENFGSAKDYSFLLWYAGSDKTGYTQSLTTINIGANSTQQIEPVWENLEGGSVQIMIDNDQDGIFEDTTVADVATDIEDDIGQVLPNNYQLAQNYPNPFNPKTTIAFTLPTKSDVKLEIINILGQKIRTLINNSLPAGNHNFEWDSKTDAGTEVSSGVYFYRLTADDFVSTKKMLLLK